MKTIPLTRGMFTLVDDEDYEWLNQWKWCACKIGHHFYAHRTTGYPKKQYGIRMHRLITNAPAGLEVDHVDRNGLNNQRSNLRLCTHKENGQNSKIPSDNKTGVKGVTWDTQRGKWLVQIQCKHVGRFDTLEEARIARRVAEVAVFGEFAPI